MIAIGYQPIINRKELCIGIHPILRNHLELYQCATLCTLISTFIRKTISYQVLERNVLDLVVFQEILKHLRQLGHYRHEEIL